MTNRIRVACVSAGLALGLAACGGGGKAGGGSAGNVAPPAPAAAKTSGGAEFGVPECDEYIAKYTACIDSKVPEATRAMVRQQLDQTKSAWKQAASTPEGRAGLTVGCRQAIDVARQAMQAYGCSW